MEQDNQTTAYQETTAYEVKGTYDPCAQLRGRISVLHKLEDQRERLLKKLNKITDKIQTLKQQPQWVLDVVDKCNEW
jgi:hypothetical protein